MFLIFRSICRFGWRDVFARSLLAKCDFKCCNCLEKSGQRKNFGFTDLSPFGREMLNVKVATNKRREQFEIYGVPSPLEGNAKCPFCSGNSGKLSKNQLKDNSTIKEGRVLQQKFLSKNIKYYGNKVKLQSMIQVPNSQCSKKLQEKEENTGFYKFATNQI